MSGSAAGSTRPGTSIRAVETRHVAVETGIPNVVLPSGEHVVAPKIHVLLIRLTGSDGCEGHAFLWAPEARQIEAFRAVMRYLARHVVGQDCSSVPATTGQLRRASNFVGYDGLAAFGVAAFEMALRDQGCRRAGESLGRRIGRRRDSVRAYRTGCLLWTPIDDLATEASEIAATGVGALKMQLGSAELAEDVERVDAVRSALPDGVALMADATQRWSFTEAWRAAERLANHGLLWLEDPLGYDDWDGYRRLAQRSPIPLATGENLFSVDGYRRLVDLGIPYVVADLERVGGIDAWLRIAEVAEQGSSVMLPHIYPHVSTQLVSTISARETWVEIVPWFDPLAKDPLQVAGGMVEVPDRPGCGFTPALDAVDDLAVGPWIELTA